MYLHDKKNSHLIDSTYSIQKKKRTGKRCEDGGVVACAVVVRAFILTLSLEC